MIRHAVIRCAWDADANVWFVQDTDIAGLVTEAPTLEALRAKLPGMVRDLVDDEIGSRHTANGVLKQAGLGKAF